jgi:hypothetical protein
MGTKLNKVTHMATRRERGISAIAGVATLILMSEQQKTTRTTGSLILVPIAGLSYFALFAAFLILRDLTQTGSLAQYQIFFIPLPAICALSAAAIWYRPVVGYLAAASISCLLVLIFFLTRDGNDVITVLSNPTRNLLQFVFYVTAVPTFFSTLVSSGFGLRRVIAKHQAGGSLVK